MKPDFFFSLILHAIFIMGVFYYKSKPPKFEGYPVVMPVELVTVKPVSFKAPEVEKIAPKQVAKPEPKLLEGVTPEKPKIVEDEPEEKPVVQEKEPEKPLEKGKSTVSPEKNIKLDVEEFPFSYYLGLLRSKIQSNWEPPFASQKKCSVFFRIGRNGQLSEVTLKTTSGDYLFDQAAVRAVMLSNPLPPLPFDFPKPSLGVEFEFEQSKY